MGSGVDLPIRLAVTLFGRNRFATVIEVMGDGTGFAVHVRMRTLAMLRRTGLGAMIGHRLGGFGRLRAVLERSVPTRNPVLLVHPRWTVEPSPCRRWFVVTPVPGRRGALLQAGEAAGMGRAARQQNWRR